VAVPPVPWASHAGRIPRRWVRRKATEFRWGESDRSPRAIASLRPSLPMATARVTLTVLGSSAATGALVACLIAGLILTPVARRWHMPFAAIGFAAVVSMIPGVLLFRTASGLLQLANGSHTTLELLSATIADGLTALITILAMSFGLIVPKLVIDHVSERSAQVKS
jgi:uncharacterized membrane protein YjjB (DUF3815 family)